MTIFNKIMVESDVKDHPRTEAILQRLGRTGGYQEIDRVDHYFGRFRKPYLQKRNNLNLYIGRKRGQLLKEAPPAYGTERGVHYYFIHQFNCIYECQYCYLQGYFNSPDIVLFINHDEIILEIERLCRDIHPDEKEVWFHAGEFSDSLALSGITREWEPYFDAFRNLTNGKLELRTKSCNTRILEELTPLPNVVVSFSLASSEQVTAADQRTPPLAARLKAMGRLARLGYRIGIHCDPIINQKDFAARFENMVSGVLCEVPAHQIDYISLGVVRFTKQVYARVKEHYPSSPLHSDEFITSFDGKVRYARPERQRLLRTAREIWLNHGIDSSLVYDCMEENQLN